MTGMYYYSAVCHLIIYSDIIYENDIHNVKEFIFMRIRIHSAYCLSAFEFFTRATEISFDELL